LIIIFRDKDAISIIRKSLNREILFDIEMQIQKNQEIPLIKKKEFEVSYAENASLRLTSGITPNVIDFNITIES